MARKFSITIDTDLYPAMNVQLDNGTIIMFKQCRTELYCYYMTNMEHNTINIQVIDYTFINTVEINKAYFHQREPKKYTKKE